MATPLVREALTSKYAWNKFTFGATPGTRLWRWRYLVSCILVGGNNEADTLRCDEVLFDKYPTPVDLAKGEWRIVTDLIESFGLKYAGNKAKHIIDTSKQVSVLGDVPDTRDGLERLSGVGRHVASVILATCYGQAEFAVDIHVRRIAQRLGLVDETASDLAIEKAITSIVAPEHLGHFSRSFVDFGQTICGYVPKCGSCLLSGDCKSATVKSLSRTTQQTNAAAGVYHVKDYTITVADGYAKCNCMAGKNGRNCRHVKGLQ